MPENDEDTQEQQNLFNQIENKVVAKILYYFKSIITLNEQKVNEINRAAYESDNTPKDISWPGNYKKYIDAIIQLFSLTKSDESKLQQKFGVPTSNEPTGSYQIYHQVSSGAPKHPELFDQIENKPLAKILSNVNPPITLNQKQVEAINQAGYNNDKTPRDISSQENYKSYVTDIIKVIYPNQNTANIQKIMLSQELQSFKASFPIMQAASQPKQASDKMNVEPSPGGLFNQIENKPLAKILSNFNPPITLNQKQVEAINQAGYNNDKTPRDISSQENYKSYVTDIIKVIYPNQNTANIQKIMLSQELQSFKASFPIMQAASQPKSSRV
ncbi:hypothetical protein NKV53_08145 [Legionella sp. 27cVA30]|uniref:hypothetical protein n=1 Tax=Legionella sp. 27cVA30 TaxID=2905657 RepID=UPI0020A07F3C|nr:hypothetical protein [Legionella sp. 27cVA30]MCP0914308.1 hypothetical protein [Legionella sp. 27cVA30]